MQVLRVKALFAVAAFCIGFIGAGSLDAEAKSGHATSSQLKFKSAGAAALKRRRPPNSSAATWQMPWQIRPIVYGSRVQRERIVEALVRKTGRVRGTRTAVATIGRSLRPARGPNRTINACRAAVSKEAVSLGAREIEAVSAGRERFTAARNIAAPVKFRITYKKMKIYEVRLSVLTCVVNRKGRLVTAYVAKSPQKRPVR